MKIKLRSLFFCLGWAFIAIDCSGTTAQFTEAAPTRTQPPSTKSSTPTVTTSRPPVFTPTRLPYTFTPTRTHTPTSTPGLPQTASPTPTDTPQAAGHLVDQCREILPTFPADAHPQGTIVLSSPDGISFVSFTHQNQREITGTIDSIATSPDGKWLSYSYNPKGEKGWKLFIESADGQLKAQVPLGDSWLTFKKGFWLDNERLWFPIYPVPGKVASIEVVNPFTGENRELASDYPGIAGYQYSIGGGAGLHFDYSSVVVDPSLDLAIYPQFINNEGYFITLWDRKNKKSLATLLDGSRYGHLPLWLPDGNQFVVVAKPQENSPKEWFIVSRDGQYIRELTHFGDQFDDFEIQNNASVSPNGRYLAFGLSLPKAGSNTMDPGNLVILDLDTLEVVNTCIPMWDFSMPVWSLDSRYLVAGAPWADNKAASPIIMLDMQQGWAAKVAEGWRFSPVGWMASP